MDHGPPGEEGSWSGSVHGGGAAGMLPSHVSTAVITSAPPIDDRRGLWTPTGPHAVHGYRMMAGVPPVVTGHLLQVSLEGAACLPGLSKHPSVGEEVSGGHWGSVPGGVPAPAGAAHPVPSPGCLCLVGLPCSAGPSLRGSLRPALACFCSGLGPLASADAPLLQQHRMGARLQWAWTEGPPTCLSVHALVSMSSPATLLCQPGSPEGPGHHGLGAVPRPPPMWPFPGARSRGSQCQALAAPGTGHHGTGLCSSTGTVPVRRSMPKHIPCEAAEPLQTPWDSPWQEEPGERGPGHPGSRWVDGPGRGWHGGSLCCCGGSREGAARDQP